ncbi:MAG: membrane protein insertion efficiency factor YidD [Chthoniobacterales bacterium]
MSALRPALRHSRFWITLFVVGVLALLAAADWIRAPSRQVSVRLYDQGVHIVYRGFVRQFSSRFVRCRFIPSCSQYSLQAMYLHGFPKGLWLTTKRICRCLPWTRMGTYDPVPLPTLPKSRTTSTPLQRE